MIGFLLPSFLSGLVIPFVTDLITKSEAPVWIKSSSNFALSALAGVVVTISIGDYSSTSDYLTAIAAAWLASMRMHYTGATKPLAAATADVGIGATPNKHAIQ